MGYAEANYVHISVWIPPKFIMAQNAGTTAFFEQNFDFNQPFAIFDARSHVGCPHWRH